MKLIRINNLLRPKKIMKNIVRMIVFSPLLLVLCLLATNVATAQQKLEETFEDGDWDGGSREVQDGCSDSDCMRVVTPSFGARNGSQAMRIEWKRNLYSSSQRGTKSTEMNAATSPRIAWAQEAWVGFSVYLPEQDPDGFKTDSKGAIIFQIMGYSGCSPSNKTAAVSVHGNRLGFSRYDRNEDVTGYTLTDNITRNRWHDVVIHFRTDLDSNDGFAEVWLDGGNDGSPNVATYNVQIGHGGSCSGGTYLKFGTYQYQSSDYANRVLYFDEIRYQTGNVGYAAVAPQGASTPPPSSGNIPIGKTITMRAVVNGKLVAALSTATALRAEGSTIGSEDRYLVVGNSDNTVSLKSVRTNQFVTVNSTDKRLYANASSINAAAKFSWAAVTGEANRFVLRSLATNAYVAAEEAGAEPLVADRGAARTWEQFIWEEN